MKSVYLVKIVMCAALLEPNKVRVIQKYKTRNVINVKKSCSLPVVLLYMLHP